MSSPSPISAAVWHLAASPLASSSTACPSPSCSTSFPTTTPNWRSKNTVWQTRSAPSSSGNVWGTSSTAATRPSRRTPMMRYITGPVWGKPSTRARSEPSCQLATPVTLNGLIAHGPRPWKTPSASNSEPMWFKINNLRGEDGGSSKLR